ncbi:MAG: hypothetical protein JWP30_1923 [Homoserinimonas sp.]|nr:hypothetical protein [Homoserinimonas sp.]
MSEFARAGCEAVVAIAITLTAAIGAFGAMIGLSELLPLTGAFYVIWAVAIVTSHLTLARQRSHVRFSVGTALGAIVMGAHSVLFGVHFFVTGVSFVAVMLHNFAFAVIALIALSIVHLIIFKRRGRRVATSREPAAFRQAVDELASPGQLRPPDTRSPHAAP